MSRALRTLSTLLLWATAAEVGACPACFGQADGPMADAARIGMWLLLAVTVGLQGAFVAFFLYLRRHAARSADHALDREWSQLQAEWDGAGRSGTR